MQNTSHAVMAQRVEHKNSLDDFPTPPWATRALIEHVVVGKRELGQMSCLEPACGRGHMSVALAPYFGSITSSDIFDYGFGGVADFLKAKHAPNSFGWVITNPPFKSGEEFILRGLETAQHGVAILSRTVFIESVGRYERLFKTDPPSRVAQFTERVPMVKGRIDKKASTATGYAWLVWEKEFVGNRTELVWIPACRKSLEREGDYQQAPRPLREEPATILPIRKSVARARGNSKERDLFSRD